MYNKKEKAVCAYGKGFVTRRVYKEVDDWNRLRSGAYDYVIEYIECTKKYK
jgi:hypothetical protein